MLSNEDVLIDREKSGIHQIQKSGNVVSSPIQTLTSAQNPPDRSSSSMIVSVDESADIISEEEK